MLSQRVLWYTILNSIADQAYNYHIHVEIRQCITKWLAVRDNHLREVSTTVYGALTGKISVFFSLVAYGSWLLWRCGHMWRFNCILNSEKIN